TATVADTSNPPGGRTTPTGTVTWSTTSGSVSPGSCALVSGSCTTTLTPPGATGTATVGASYGGDSGHDPSAGSTTVTIAKRATSTTVSCVPSSMPVNG